eukprot:14248166-Ditylum_brightwellii.AAC.2
MQGINNPRLKTQWDIDMLAFLHSIDQEDEILLLMDASNNLDSNHFSTFVANSGLYDIIGSKLGNQKTPTYIRGKKTIDWILGTQAILDTARCIQWYQGVNVY